MKTSFIKKSNSGLTVTDYLFFIVIIGVVYGCYLYVPLVYRSQELEAILKDYTFKSGAASEDKLRDAVIEDAKSKLDITLNAEEVIVEKAENRTKIQATWHAPIELPFGYIYYREFKVEYSRKSTL